MLAYFVRPDQILTRTEYFVTVPGWHRYTFTLWVHGTAQSLPQSALQLTRMAPISTGQLVSLSSCGHTPSVPDPRVTV